MSFFKSEIRQKFSQEFINKTDRQRLTNEEFVDKLNKSKYILFQIEFDDVKIFISGFGNNLLMSIKESSFNNGDSVFKLEMN